LRHIHSLRIYLIRFIVFLVIISLGFFVPQKRQSDVLKIGSYVSDRYEKRLIETKSPLLAEEDSIAYAAEVIENDSYLPVIYGNFHEGWGELDLDSDGEIFDVKETPEGTAYAIKVINPERFVLTSPQGIQIDFHYCGNEDDVFRRLSKLLMEGKYFDTLNREFSFSDSTFLTPEGNRYNYVIEIDYAGDGPPYDCLNLNTVPYRFSFSHDTLTINETYGNNNTKVRYPAKWMLKKR